MNNAHLSKIKKKKNFLCTAFNIYIHIYVYIYIYIYTYTYTYTYVDR